MPELSEPAVGGGFWIRRVNYSRTDMEDKNKIRRFSPTDNKENSSRLWRRSPAARLRRSGKSPLPEWYPRTPLRDITSIVKAYERKRLRIQAAQNSAAAAAASPSAGPRLQVANPQSQEPSTASQASLKPTIEAFPSITTATTMTAAAMTTKESPLQAEEAPKTPTTLIGLVNDGPPETESTLLNSIEHIEKAVTRNIRAMKKPESKRATQLRSLMSMR